MSALSVPIVDPDMREYRQSLALEALSRRDSSKHATPLRATRGPNAGSPASKHSILKQGAPAARPLFLDEDDTPDAHSTDEDDPSFKEAIYRSITDSEQREAEELSAALAESSALYAEAEKEDLQRARQFHSSRASAYSGSTYVTLMSRMDGPAAKFAAVRSAAVGETSSHIATATKTPSTSVRDPLGSPKSTRKSAPSPSTKRSPTASRSPAGGSPSNQAKISPAPSRTSPPFRRTSGASNQSRSDTVVYTPSKGKGHSPSQHKQDALTDNSVPPPSGPPATPDRSSCAQAPIPPHENAVRQTDASDEQDAEAALSCSQPISMRQPTPAGRPNDTARQFLDPPLNAGGVPGDLGKFALQSAPLQSKASASRTASDNLPGTPPRRTSTAPPAVEAAQRTPHYETFEGERGEPQTRGEEGHAHNEWDEIDVAAEQAQFASFFSQVQNRSVDQLREEIDQELRALQAQKKAAMRDSEDITQQMVGQIQMMLRLFGIPYVTAPMEAEAQCATLVALGLVEGIITDDSDVFLFGGERVYRNMFNQSKTVECFLAADLARELGLDRDNLVRLACLLGSDYTDGLPGVGPVIAMELLKEFPGENGLHRFKNWWRKVQSGRDRPDESSSPFRRRFVGVIDAIPHDSGTKVGTLQKKRFKDLHLSDDWPPAVVVNSWCSAIAFVNIR
jgi:DNA excision repair protein ERCC-5